MAKRSFLRVVGVVENMSSFTCEHGTSYALFGEGGGAALAEAIGAPLLGQIPLEPAVAAAGDAGDPISIDGVGAAADMFRSIADRIVTEIAPLTPAEDIDMAGCTARLFDSVNAALASHDAAASGDAAMDSGTTSVRVRKTGDQPAV